MFPLNDDGENELRRYGAWKYKYVLKVGRSHDLRRSEVRSLLVDPGYYGIATKKGAGLPEADIFRDLAVSTMYHVR